ncbi:lipoate--protein ligase family protein [Candidatus Woesearchaeota archaeon]|nr:lipoate--protein ligase family protein [Candidatus Woesearchaeota archaeon]
MQFRLIDTGYNNAAMNMAIDEALLESKLPVLRVYQWKPAALSLGYFQNIRDINLKECKKRNVDIVRRITGGKTVLHDKELTYSFIIDEKSMPKSVIESYKIISKGILHALKSLGINVSMKKSVKKNKNKSAVCFNEPSYYEIVVNGKKIVGSAQTRRKGKLLQHGSILLDVDYDKLISLFNMGNKEEIIKLSKQRITSIKKFNKKISLEKIKKYLKQGFEKNLKVKLFDDELTDNEIKLAKKLAKDKYSTKKWNLK